MADVAASLRSLLLANAPIAALIGTRIYSDHLPQGGITPAITYRIISEINNEDLGGSSGLDEARFQIDCYGATRSDANTLHKLVRGVLKTYRGTHNTTHFKTITQATGQQYLTDRPEDATDQYRYITTQDFTVFYATD